MVLELMKNLFYQTVRDSRIDAITAEIDNIRFPAINPESVDEDLSRMKSLEQRIETKIHGWMYEKRNELGSGWSHLSDSYGFKQLERLYTKAKTYLNGLLHQDNPNYRFSH